MAEPEGARPGPHDREVEGLIGHELEPKDVKKFRDDITGGEGGNPGGEGGNAGGEGGNPGGEGGNPGGEGGNPGGEGGNPGGDNGNSGGDNGNPGGEGGNPGGNGGNPGGEGGNPGGNGGNPGGDNGNPGGEGGNPGGNGGNPGGDNGNPGGDNGNPGGEGGNPGGDNGNPGGNGGNPGGEGGNPGGNGGNPGGDNGNPGGEGGNPGGNSGNPGGDNGNPGGDNGNPGGEGGNPGGDNGNPGGDNGNPGGEGGNPGGDNGNPGGEGGNPGGDNGNHGGEGLIGHELQPKEAQNFRNRILGRDGENPHMFGDSRNPRPIVLFGEGNFTFSIALASLRTNGSDGIIATGWHVELPKFDDVKKKAIDYCKLNGKKMQLSDEEAGSNAEKVSKVPDFSTTWQIQVSALQRQIDIRVDGKVVWFQCPWSDTTRHTTAGLIQCFMEKMKQRQVIGDILVIGISTHEDYIKKYNLNNILGDGSGKTIIHGYRYLGHDENIIKMILGRGYKHEGVREIHNYIIDTHSTLVFKREDDVVDISGLAKGMDGMEVSADKKKGQASMN